ncbi:MAG: molecular chaperone DnaJ [Acidimicrobiales bacterium]
MVEPQREWFDKDYYAVLGVPESASAKDVTKAYRKLARELHPDANPGDTSAEERFKEVSAAYDVLGDDAKRKSYDEVRRLGPMAGGFGPFGHGAEARFDTGGADLGDLLGGLFGRGRRGGPRSRPSASRPSGADLEADLHLDFTDAVHGLTTTVHLTSDAPCRDCGGAGAEPGSHPRRCPSCEGTGVLDENQGLFSFSRPCTTCGGRGSIIEKPCSTCRGTGVERRPREIKVRIPPGVRDAQRIKLIGRGAPGRNGGPPGDLYVRVHVKPHPLFGRKGDDLTLAVPVTFAEATLGADITVPTLDGPPITIRVPAGTRSGRTFRVKGRGAGPKGDLLVVVEVVVPQKLSADERTAVEALAAASKSSPRAHLGV